MTSNQGKKEENWEWFDVVKDMFLSISQGPAEMNWEEWEADRKYRKTKGKVGRPTKKTESTIAKLEAAFKFDFTISEACTYAGIDPMQYYRWSDKDPKFRYRMERARNVPFQVAKFVLIASLAKGNAQVAMAMLEKRQGQLYSKRKDELPPEEPLDGEEMKEIFNVIEQQLLPQPHEQTE